jgi:hypothetical protein
VLTSRGTFSISLALSNTGNLIGAVLTSDTTSGEVSFTSLRISTPGSFTIDASSNDVTQGSSASFTLTTYVSSITLTSSNASPTIGFQFTLTATLKTEENVLYTGSCTVALSETSSCLSGDTSKTTTSGTALMDVYCSSTGEKTITASCPAITGFPEVHQIITLTFQQKKLKFVALSPSVISK